MKPLLVAFKFQTFHDFHNFQIFKRKDIIGEIGKEGEDKKVPKSLKLRIFLKKSKSPKSLKL